MVNCQETINKWYSKRAGSLYDFLQITSEISGGRNKLFKILDIKPDSKILEIGVGTGLNIKKYPSQAEYFCLDINSKMLKHAQKKAKKSKKSIQICQGSAKELPFPDNSFDYAILTYALSGIPCNSKALYELERVVKSDGKIGILDYAYHQPGNRAFADLDLSALVLDRKNSEIIYTKPLRFDIIDYLDGEIPQHIYILNVK